MQFITYITIYLSMQKQIKKIFSYIDKLLRIVAQWFIRLYQRTFSPDKSPLFRPFLAGRVCRHTPHCSEYGHQCFQHYNFFTACFRTMDRISRCTPWNTKTYDPVKYRVVFASWSPIGVPFLQALVEDPRYEVVGVLTMPDMPSGRGMKMQENIISQTAQQLHVTTIKKPRSLRLDSKKYADEAQETYKRLQSLDVDILYVVAYGNILPQHILDVPKIAPINIHGSLLPAYRGASPLQTVFLDGLSQTGITLMKMEVWLDSGPMIDKQIFKLGFSDTVVDLMQRVKDKTPSWSLDSIDRYVHGELEEEIQDETQVSHCGKINKEDGQIDFFKDTLDSVWKKYKAYAMWPKIYTLFPTKNWDKKLIVIEELVLDETEFSESKHQSLYDWNKLNSAVIQLKIKPEGKKSMSWDDFKRWYL